MRAARAAARRAVAELRLIGGAARPWLRREHWTRENLLALAGAARRRPGRLVALLAGTSALLLLLAWALGGG